MAKRRRGHVLTPRQSGGFILPTHAALSLLPLGLFTEDHGNELAMVLHVVTVATEGFKESVYHESLNASGVLIKMKERAEAKGSWNVTSGERQQLLHSVTLIDRWLQGANSIRVMEAMRKVEKLWAKAEARGQKPSELIQGSDVIQGQT